MVVMNTDVIVSCVHVQLYCARVSLNKLLNEQDKREYPAAPADSDGIYLTVVTKVRYLECMYYNYTLTVKLCIMT